MAKKKKHSRKKHDEDIERSPFWPLAGGVVLCVLALFMLLGGFGTGGALPVNMFKGGYWAFGWAAYLLPVALAYWGVHKFIGEDNRIPRGKLFSMLGVLVFVSAWLFSGFAKEQASAWVGGHGGYVGQVLGGAVLQALDPFPASLMFAIFALLSLFFAFGINPKVILALGGLFKRGPMDSELGDLKARAESSGFQLNEGVPTIHHSGRPFAGLRGSAEKLAPAQNHEALTLASDPDWKFPGIDLLDHKQDKADAGNVQGNAEIIKDTFANFNIDVEMEGANVGPRVTQYTLKPPANVKLTKITALEKT